MNDYVGKHLGNYRLTKSLGDGAFANVYLGEHIYLTNKKVAIKVLKGAFTEEHIERFRKEAQTIHNLQHPHIVQVIDFGVTTIDRQTIPFLVMDYAPNGSLSKRYPSGTLLPLATIISYLKPLAEALQYAHDEHVIHRDIKPANLLLGKDDLVLLSDFGIAVTAHATYSMPIQDVSGTPAYMAPEQFDGRSRLASDQYALGVIIYEWLCGERPFSGPSFALYALQHKTVPPTSLMKMGATISPSIDQIVLRTLEKDPKLRFPRIQDFADAFEQAYYTYEKEITTSLDHAEYTTEMLRSEDVQYALLHRSHVRPEWWENEAKAKINALRLKGEKNTDEMIETVLTALAEKAKRDIVTAIHQEDGVVFETMFSIITSCATPSSRYPVVWTALFQELANGSARTFITRHEAIYSQFLKQWSYLSPPINTSFIRPWLPLSWQEFGALFSLRLPDEWMYQALIPLLDSPIPSEVSQSFEQNDSSLMKDFFQYLLAPQRRSVAVRWFIRLGESGYKQRMSLLPLLFGANLSIQEMQQARELVFTSPHFTQKEYAEILETYGKQFISHISSSPSFVNRVREYVQTLAIGELENQSSTKNFLRILSDNVTQFPADFQPILKGWRTIIDFVDHPTFEKALLKDLATAISFLPSEIYPQLISVLATALASCIEDEFDLIHVVSIISPVFKSETLALLYTLAAIEGKTKHQHDTDSHLIAFIRFSLEIEKVYNLFPTTSEQFRRLFLENLLQEVSNDTLRNVHRIIITQHWPQKVFTWWNGYVSTRIPLSGTQSKKDSVPHPVKRLPARRSFSRQRTALLIGLVAVIVTGSIGIFSFTRSTSVPNPYSPYTGTLALDDSLSGNTFTWPQGTDPSGSCNFTKGAYHVNGAASSSGHFCTNGVSNFNNFAYQVRMTIVKGDSGGIIFRCDNTSVNYYFFRIDQDGSYTLDLVRHNFIQHLKNGTDPSINTGLHQSNEIAVVAEGNILTLYVNFHKISSVTDSTYSSGEIGVVAASTGDPTEVTFNNAQVWSL